MISFIGVIGAIMGLKRKCPRCGRDQVVHRDKRHETVQCKFCGADVPPKRK